MFVGFLWTKLPLQPLHIPGILSPAEVLLALLEMSPAPDRTGPQVALWSCTVLPFCRPGRPQRTDVVDPLSPGELLSGRKPAKSSQPHNLISTIRPGESPGPTGPGESYQPPADTAGSFPNEPRGTDRPGEQRLFAWANSPGRSAALVRCIRYDEETNPGSMGLSSHRHSETTEPCVDRARSHRTGHSLFAPTKRWCHVAGFFPGRQHASIVSSVRNIDYARQDGEGDV